MHRTKRKSRKNAGTLTRTYHQIFSGKNIKSKQNRHKMRIVFSLLLYKFLVHSVRLLNNLNPHKTAGPDQIKLLVLQNSVM